MSQTLTRFPGLSVPTSPAGAATLSKNISAIANLDNRQVLSLAILGKIHECYIVYGIDYRANHKQLRTDAAGLMGAIPGVGVAAEPLSRVEAVIAWNAGLVSDSTTPTDVNALVAEMGRFREIPEQTLRQIYYFLLYLVSTAGS